jgi:hypothetical protein
MAEFLSVELPFVRPTMILADSTLTDSAESAASNRKCVATQAALLEPVRSA